MKANKPGETTLSGKVVKKTFGKNSKSEHQAIYLEISECSYQLRRMGGNAFSDPELNKLVGKNITAIGILTGNLFLASHIKEI